MGIINFLFIFSQLAVTMGSQVGAPGTGQCSLSFILDSCESPTELFVKAEDIVLSTVSGHKLPTWSPDTSEAIIKWTHKV